MDKLNLNQSLRIFIPGLAIGILLFVLFGEQLSLDKDDSSFILLPSIFFGFALHLITINTYSKFFKRILRVNRFDQKDFYSKWKYNLVKNIENQGIKKIDLPDNKSDLIKLYNFIDEIFFCKRYSDNNLIFFRFYKSLGIMFFNISCAGVIVFIVTLLFKIHLTAMIVTCILIFLIFFFGSIWFSFYSAKRELIYWMAFSKKELKEVKALINLWVKIKEDND